MRFPAGALRVPQPGGRRRADRRRRLPARRDRGPRPPTSEVWRAHRTEGAPLEVAVKRARRDGVAPLGRLRAEAEILAELDLPNVVRVLDVVADGGDVAIVMDLARGGSLDELLARQGRLAAGEVVAVVAPLALALGAATGAGCSTATSSRPTSSSATGASRCSPTSGCPGRRRPWTATWRAAPLPRPPAARHGSGRSDQRRLRARSRQLRRADGPAPPRRRHRPGDPRRGGEGSPPAVARGPRRAAPPRRGHRGRAGPRSGRAASERRVLRRHPPGGRRTRRSCSLPRASPGGPSVAAAARGRRRHAELRSPAGPAAALTPTPSPRRAGIIGALAVVGAILLAGAGIAAAKVDGDDGQPDGRARRPPRCSTERQRGTARGSNASRSLRRAASSAPIWPATGARVQIVWDGSVMQFRLDR